MRGRRGLWNKDGIDGNVMACYGYGDMNLIEFGLRFTVQFFFFFFLLYFSSFAHILPRQRHNS